MTLLTRELPEQAEDLNLALNDLDRLVDGLGDDKPTRRGRSGGGQQPVQTLPHPVLLEPIHPLAEETYMSGPISPEEYGEGMNDEQLQEAGWAAGLTVWGQVEKAYGNYLGDLTLANSQLWSLRQAIRAELLAELGREQEAR